MPVKKPEQSPFHIPPEAMARFRTALDNSFDGMRKMTMNVNNRLIDPSWLDSLEQTPKPTGLLSAFLENEQKLAQTNGAAPKVEEEAKGYNGEWYQGPIPDTYEGKVPKEYSGRYRSLSLDDERKRIYCYEEDQWGTLRRKFIAQTDNKTIAEWIVAARNGRLVGKNDSEAVVGAAETIAGLKFKLTQMTQARDIAAANGARYALRAADAEQNVSALRDQLDRLQTYVRNRDAELKALKEQVEAGQNARMAQIKDAGTRKLRLRAKG